MPMSHAREATTSIALAFASNGPKGKCRCWLNAATTNPSWSRMITPIPTVWRFEKTATSVLTLYHGRDGGTQWASVWSLKRGLARCAGLQGAQAGNHQVGSELCRLSLGWFVLGTQAMSCCDCTTCTRRWWWWVLSTSYPCVARIEGTRENQQTHRDALRLYQKLSLLLSILHVP